MTDTAPVLYVDPASPYAYLAAELAAAWEAGVRGVPTLRLADGTVFYGDDRLEEAAEALRATAR